jgi:FlaA1/EpsC-like NDP-sugar epimerase
MSYKNKTILVTGGTGSIGSAIVRNLLQFSPRQIRILSRDESKQHDLLHELNGDPRIRLLIGDVRDRDRVNMAMENVDVVFHAAAMKHVLSCENDPFEAVKTNVLGTQNVIDSAMSNGVAKVVGISTDKATDPASVMGSTKLLAERIMLASRLYQGHKKTKICFVRFGNVLSTRGSVVPLFYRQIKNGGPVTVTDGNMVRFFMSIDEAINLVFKAAEIMNNREIFVLKMPVIKIVDLAQAMIEIYGGANAKNIKIKNIGKKSGERIDEKLLSKEEAAYALATDEMFIIPPVLGNEMFTSASGGVKNNLNHFPGAKRSIHKDYSTEDKAVLSLLEIKKRLVKDEKSMMRALGLL